MRSLLRAADWLHELPIRIATKFAISFVLCATLAIVGYAAVGVIVGDAALQRLRSQDAARVGWRVGAAMAAMLALALLTRIPFLGGLVTLAALLAGLGALALVLRAKGAWGASARAAENPARG